MVKMESLLQYSGFALLYQQVVQGVGEGRWSLCCLFWSEKAFDSVPRVPLLAKLSYLADWTQAVHGYKWHRVRYISCTRTLCCSTELRLGPLLFLVYVNDLSWVTRTLSSKVNLFAEDILLYRVITNDYDVLQEAIILLAEWFIANYLTFSQPKCKYMVISCKQARISSTNIPLSLHNISLGRVASDKYLGLLLANNLSWSLHAANVYTKAMKVLGLLYRRFYGYAESE